MTEGNRVFVEVVEQKQLNLYQTHIKENFHIYGVASILYGILYVFCMYKNDAGITFPLLVAGTIGYVVFVLRKLEMKLKKESWFYIISMMLLGISTFCTADWRIIFFNKTGVFLLTLAMVLGIVYDTSKWNLGKYLGTICKVCVMSIGEVCKPFSDAVWYCKNRLGQKHSKYLYLLIGVGITIPVVGIVFSLLTSADAVFRDKAEQVLAGLSMGDFCGMALMFLFVTAASYCVVAYLSKKEIKEEITDSRKWEPLIGIPLASVLSLLYLVFSGIQIVYLFMGNMQLPEGYTYAEYAREGFFQLLAVSIINLVIVLIGLYYFKPNRVLKAVLAIMSLCTFIMIASSAMRMVIYIQYYYLTFLRILVLWSLAVLTLIFAGVIAYIVKERFPLFRYSLVVFTCFYIGLSFSHPDYWIAKVNLASTSETRSSFFKSNVLYEDYDFLSGLNADAAPVLVEWIKEEGYSLDCYYIDTMSFRAYQILNNIPVDGEKKTYEEILEEEKLWCAYRYLGDLQKECKELSLREFNLSRFLADFQVLYQNDNMVKIINKSQEEIYGIGYSCYDDGYVICSGGACNADNSAIKTGAVFVLDNSLFEEEPKSVEIELSVMDAQENEYPCAVRIFWNPYNQKACNIEITGDYEKGFCATVVGEK